MKKIFLKIFIPFFALLSSFEALSQDLGIPMQYIVEGGDTLFISEVPPAYKIKRISWGKKDKAWREYYRLVHNFSKTYPYALLAKEMLDSADNYLSTNDLSARKKEKYLSELEEDLFDTFEEPLKKLTFTQGRILLRLIDREVGLSSFYIIKNYRGGAAAGFWQGVAKIFGSNLKTPYNKFEGEDKKLEQLVTLYQNGEFNSLYVSIFGRFPPEPVVRPSSKYDYPQLITPPKDNGWRGNDAGKKTNEKVNKAKKAKKK